MTAVELPVEVRAGQAAGATGARVETLRREAGEVQHQIIVRRPAVPWERPVGTPQNGWFMLVDPSRNLVVAGERFDLSDEAIIEHCRR